MQPLGPPLNSIIVRLQIRLKQLVRIHPIPPQTFQHLRITKVRQRRVINLHVPTPIRVQHLQLLLITLCQITKKLIITAIDTRVIALPRRQSQVEITRRRHCKLTLPHLTLINAALQHPPVLQIWRLSRIPNLSLAHGRHGVLLPGLLERSNWWGAQPGQLPRHRHYLLKAIKLLEETMEVPLAVKLARTQGAHPVLLLRRHDVGNGCALDCRQIGGRELAGVGLGLRFGQRGGADKGADMVGVEGELCGTHFGGFSFAGGEKLG
jgi:hypothetical protein